MCNFIESDQSKNVFKYAQMETGLFIVFVQLK